MAKIIAKLGPSEDERVKNRQAARMARRDQMRQEELDRERELKKEQARLDDMVRPHDKAIDKMKELESKTQVALEFMIVQSSQIFLELLLMPLIRMAMH